MLRIIEPAITAFFGGWFGITLFDAHMGRHFAVAAIPAGVAILAGLAREALDRRRIRRRASVG